MIVEINDLSFSHEDSHVPLLKNVSFKLPKGSITCICGHNGGGKSTLLALIAGVLQATSGTIKVSEYSLPQQEDLLRGHVALAPQDPDLYILGTIVREDLLLSIPKNNTRSIEKALTLASELGLAEKLELPVHFLSFGEKRKLCLASALAGISGKELQLLLLDEPFAGLDHQSALAMRNILKTNRYNNLSQIVVTHELDYIFDIADYFLLLNKGEVYFFGSSQNAEKHFEQVGVRPLIKNY